MVANTKLFLKTMLATLNLNNLIALEREEIQGELSLVHSQTLHVTTYIK